MPKSDVPRGTGAIRNTVREMLKYLDRYGRKMKQAVPEARLDRYEAAVAKILAGCEELLDIQLEDEDDASFRYRTRR